MARQSLAPPQSRAPVVLLTRPIAQNQRFAAQLQATLGPLLIIQSPLMAPEFLQPDFTDQIYTSLILTSGTGVEVARRLIAAGRSLPKQAFCVGDQTAKAAQAIGLNAISAKGDAEALISLILAQNSRGPFLHICGADTRGDIGKTLSNSGIVTHSLTAYVQNSQPLTTEAHKELHKNQPVIVPVFSPRSAQLLAQALPADYKAALQIAAISPAAAEMARIISPAKLVIADSPTAGSLLGAIANLISFASDA